MPRKGENIYKRKDGRWEGRYIRSYDSEHKAKYAYVYGKTYSEVKRKLTEQRGNVQKVQPTKNKSSTYGELLDCWLHSMQLNTKESTQARYTHLIKTHIKPHLGAVQLSQLTTDAIEIFIEQQLTDGRLDNSGGLSPKTVTDILTIIKSTIEYARYKELPVICNLSKLSIKKKEKEMRVFTPSEQESLIGTLTNDMDHSKFGVLLSLYTGIRVGELCALQWEDFDLAHSKLKIRKTMQRIQDLGNGSVSKTKIVITEPKSQCSIREIPLPLFIVDVAKKFASNPKAYILTGTDRYIEPRTMQNRFKSYVKECNVEPANFHVLRHTFATRCVEVGFEVNKSEEIIEHLDDQAKGAIRAMVMMEYARCNSITNDALGFYIGVRSVDNTSTAEAILEKSFKGNFAGSQIQAIPQEEVQKVLGSINKSGRFGTRQNVSSVSIVPSTRDEDKERFVQGIEKFIDTMKGSEYTAVFIAEPLDKEILEQRKRGLQKIYSGLSPFASTQLSYGENYSKAVSKGMSENFSKTLNDSLTDTTSHFNSRSTSRSHGTSFGFLGIGFNNSTSTGYSSGSSWASAVTRGTSETKGETVTETDTDTTGDSRTITVTSENKSVKYILEKIDQHLARIKNCEAFGLWDIACYFVSENVQTSVVAASTYKALMAGFDSGVENSYVNVWKQDNTENTPALLEYLRYCIHPRFSIPGDDQFFEVESQTVNPCSLISGNEMPYIMGLPHHSVPGVTVLNMAEFGRNVRFSSGAPRGKKVELGQVIFQYETGLAADEGFQLDDLLEVINNSDINASKKQDIVQSMVDWCSCFEREAPVNGSFAAKLAEFISCNGLFEALPIRFAKDYKNEPKITRDCIDKKDLASIRNWHSRVYDHLDSYVLLTDENIKNRVLRYLLLNKRVEEINYNKYQLIYEGIYGKARGNK